MCGIVGILGLKNSQINKFELDNFKNSLHHRGPDGTGIYLSDDNKVGLVTQD